MTLLTLTKKVSLVRRGVAVDDDVEGVGAASCGDALGAERLGDVVAARRCRATGGSNIEGHTADRRLLGQADRKGEWRGAAVAFVLTHVADRQRDATTSSFDGANALPVGNRSASHIAHIDENVSLGSGVSPLTSTVNV